MATTLIGRGRYDASEVALLCGLAPVQVVRWSVATANGDAPITASFDRLFSFADLVAFAVAQQIRANGVSDRHLRRGVAVARLLRHGEPARRAEVIDRLATSGDSLARLADGSYEDTRRQGTFQEVIGSTSGAFTLGVGSAIELGAGQWRSIDPEVPALRASRAHGRRGVRSSANLDDIAFDLEIELSAIEAAIQFEELLARGDGLPV